jgi:hypothetical protein
MSHASWRLGGARVARHSKSASGPGIARFAAANSAPNLQVGKKKRHNSAASLFYADASFYVRTFFDASPTA